MKYVKLTKAIKTKVVSYQKNPDGTYLKDDKDARVVATEREISISDVEIPQFESLAEAVQKAGNEDLVLAALNDYTKSLAVAPVRIVGNKFDTETPDDKIIAEGRAAARTINPFVDSRGAANAVNKQKAQQFDALQAALKDPNKSKEDLIAMLTAGMLN